MTDAWGALIFAVSAAQQQPPPSVDHIDNVLTVEWHHKQIRPADGAVIFSGGVVATYGPTTLHADSLTIYQTDKRKEGFAQGSVVLDDPDGHAKAQYLTFDWLHRTGHGTTVELASDGLVLRAESVEIAPNGWVLAGVKAAPDGSKHPLFAVSSPRVTVRPNGNGTARRMGLSILGAKLVTLPTYRFGAKQEQDGMKLPSISYNQGLGIAWRSSYLVDDRTRWTGALRAKKNARPGVQVEVSRSLLPRNEPGTLRPPASDLGERFASGYFDSVYVRRPSEETADIGSRRSSITLGLTANQTPVARLTSDLITKPFDFVAEEGRTVAGFGLVAAARYQSIQEDNGPNERRGVVSLTALAPQLSFGRGFSTVLRTDTTGYIGSNNFAWAQLQAGLVYNPTPTVRLGAAYVYGSETGTPTFQFDRLAVSRAFHGRIDLDLGTTKFSFLTKYDLESRKWYDNEFGISQVVGPLEPFITFREFPRTVTFGVRLRAEQAFDRLRRRLEKRTPNRIDDRP